MIPAFCQPLFHSRRLSPTVGALLAEGTWRLMAAPYTFHCSRDSDYRPVCMVGRGGERKDGIVCGGATSALFGQPAAGGKHPEGQSAFNELYAQWTTGVLYGYKGAYKDKMPFNVGGFSPGVVLSFGWQFTPVYSALATCSAIRR